MARLRKDFQEFLKSTHGLEAVIFHDRDADGIAAGVLLEKGLERLGRASRRMMPGRERDPWSPAHRSALAEARPQALYVLDLGSRREPLVEGVPTCFIDHHFPEGIPDSGLLLSGFELEPVPNTSLLVWELLQGHVLIDDLDWIAAIGTLSDLGEKAPFDLITHARERHTAKALKEVVALVNAVRRVPGYDPEHAARALHASSSPKELVSSRTPDVLAMRQAREELKLAMNEAKKAAPRFSGPVALIEVSSGCQVHSLLAQIWRTRLPKYIVMVANDAYLPGRVNFSTRAPQGVNLIEFFARFKIEGTEGGFGQGHREATGGSLPPKRWAALLQALGFETKKASQAA